MKRFIIYALSVSLPLLLLLLFLEIVTGQVPNSYYYKYNYVKKHGDRIEALAIGHSQLYDGFKSESFFLPSFNLCNSAQNYMDNYYLLCELLPFLPHLKVVIIPIGYVNVGDRTDIKELSFSDRACYYHKYMNLDYDGNIPPKYRYESLDPLRASKKIINYYILKADMVGCDSLGRRSTHYLRDRKHKLVNEECLFKYTKKGRSYQDLCIENEDFLNKIFNMLMDRQISIVLVSPPYYWNCGFKYVNEVQRQYVKKYMNSICRKYPVLYFDYESDSTFVYDDFFNETHLSEVGAEKFTVKLSNDFIKTLHKRN